MRYDPSMTGPFKIIGHRGAAGYLTENTLPSLQRAIDLGATWVEFDVRLSQDGIPVVVHDESLSRALKVQGKVSRLSAKALMDLGVPSLDEVLDLLEVQGVGAYVEIKAATDAGLSSILERVRRDHGPRIISAFDHNYLGTLREMDNEVSLQALFSSVPFKKPAYLDRIAPVELGVSAKKLQSSAPSRILGWGYPVVAYTVNDKEEALRLMDQGLSGIFTDYPDLMAR